MIAQTLTKTKNQKLIDYFKKYHSVIVAFSGGVDSTAVLYAAIKALGKGNVISVIANSELYSQIEYEKAKKLSQNLGAKTVVTTIQYLKNEDVRNNTPDSWYYAKKMFYDRLNNIKQQFNADVVIDGMNKDDLNDYRPGFKARDEAGALSPLQELGFTKQDVRQFTHDNGLKNWNKVHSCSISSRFPYNTVLTHQKIERVMAAENYLRGKGFDNVRVRYVGTSAQIEVEPEKMDSLFKIKNEIYNEFKKLGFLFVTVDLGGFKSGNMNSELSQKQIFKYRVY